MDVEKKASPQQIIGDGIPITLVDGSVVRLKVSNRAMVKVDELFGSYFEMQSLLQASGRPAVGNHDTSDLVSAPA